MNNQQPITNVSEIERVSTTRLAQSANPKVIVAGMELQIKAFYDEGSYIAGKSTIIIQDDSNRLKTLWAIINGRLVSFWFSVNYNSLRMSAGYFNIGVNELSTIPVALPQDTTPFIEKSDIMLSLNAELSAKRARFCKRLADNLVDIRITGALERFDELEFKQFLAELKKQKIALSLRQQDEWGEYFNENRTACQTLATQITATYHQIDQMVYSLYGLTDEEIQIIEHN